MLRFWVLLLLLPGMAFAEGRRPSHCIAIADALPGAAFVQKAAFSDPVPEGLMRISYIDHSMFLIGTAGGLRAVTDYNGWTGLIDAVPDEVTMNHAHSTHWTASPDPRIPHVLKGWGDAEGPADHHLDLGEMLIRNVPTDIRRGAGRVETGGNSIFVFEVEGLCIGHLGHLHHEPDAAQYAALGRLDVVMVPVDGGMTLDLPTMIRVVERLRSSVVIPMHWFGPHTLSLFLSGLSERFAVEIWRGASIEVGLRTLPDRPTVVVLQPMFLSE